MDQKNRLKNAEHSAYKGFVAGAFSGVAKLIIGHPFDTIKVRMQTTGMKQFNGPVQCFLATVRNEGFGGLYKGATPPMVGWMIMDSVMWGSLNIYRKFLLQAVFTPEISRKGMTVDFSEPVHHLPALGHGIAGIMAGVTVSIVAAPVEHIKARLQVQYAAQKSERRYKGTVDCIRKIYQHHGTRGIYHGFQATLIFRSFFFFWFGSQEMLTRVLEDQTKLSKPAVNFWAGGLSAQVFWITCYPTDVIKQRIMTDPLGGSLNDGVPKFPTWRAAALTIYRENGIKGYWRGFLPCFVRAFPANAIGLVAFHTVMRSLP